MLAIDPTHVPTLYDMSKIYLLKQEWEEAAKGFMRVVELDPRDGDAHYHLAVAYYYLKKFDDAVRHYDISKELNFQGKEELGQWLAPYRQTEFSILYTSLVIEPGKEVVITMKGAGYTGEEKALILDTLKAVEPIAASKHKKMFSLIKTKFVGISQDGKSAELEWAVIDRDGVESMHTIKYLYAERGGTEIRVETRD